MGIVIDFIGLDVYGTNGGTQMLQTEVGAISIKDGNPAGAKGLEFSLSKFRFVGEPSNTPVGADGRAKTAEDDLMTTSSSRWF